MTVTRYNKSLFNAGYPKICTAPRDVTKSFGAISAKYVKKIDENRTKNKSCNESPHDVRRMSLNK